jgi:hypothetical protein
MATLNHSATIGIISCKFRGDLYAMSAYLPSPGNEAKMIEIACPRTSQGQR